MSPHAWFGKRFDADLLAKARRDLRQLEQNPSDEDTAFDFFVTARHVLDWPSAQGVRRTPREIERIIAASVVLHVCDDVANRVKHFGLARNPSERAVSGTETEQGGFDAGFDSGFEREHLVIELEGAAAEALGRRPHVAVVATRIVEELARLLDGLASPR